MKHPGYLLEEALTRSGISQRTCSRRCGINQRTISEIVTGKRDFTADYAVVLASASALNVRECPIAQMEYDIDKATRKRQTAPK